MKYERFEDLPVWQAAADTAAKMFQWTTLPWFRGKGDLCNQLQRATLSISNNIAEGFERGTTNELLQFLYIARGSAGEVRSMLSVMERMDEVTNLKSQISDFKSQCESISRQIRGWTNSLQNSTIQGQRHLNDATKQAFDQQKSRDAFLKKLDAANEEAQRKREAARQEQDRKPNE
jgi:four helix bundle protein